MPLPTNCGDAPVLRFVRKHVGDDSVPVAVIAASTGHHITLGHSCTLIDLGAKLKWLAAEKARFKMLGVGHRHFGPLCRSYRKSKLRDALRVVTVPDQRSIVAVRRIFFCSKSTP